MFFVCFCFLLFFSNRKKLLEGHILSFFLLFFVLQKIHSPNPECRRVKLFSMAEHHSLSMQPPFSQLNAPRLSSPWAAAHWEIRTVILRSPCLLWIESCLSRFVCVCVCVWICTTCKSSREGTCPVKDAHKQRTTRRRQSVVNKQNKLLTVWKSAGLPVRLSPRLDLWQKKKKKKKKDVSTTKRKRVTHLLPFSFLFLEKQVSEMPRQAHREF